VSLHDALLAILMAVFCFSENIIYEDGMYSCNFFAIFLIYNEQCPLEAKHLLKGTLPRTTGTHVKSISAVGRLVKTRILRNHKTSQGAQKNIHKSYPQI
jgi:hypothetical protein